MKKLIFSIMMLASVFSYAGLENLDYCNSFSKNDYHSKYSCFSRKHARLLYVFKTDGYTPEEYLLLSKIALNAAAYAELYVKASYSNSGDGEYSDKYRRISQYQARIASNHLASYYKIMK